MAKKQDFSVIFTSLEELKIDPSTRTIFEMSNLAMSVRQEVDELRKFVAEKDSEDKDSVYTRT